MPHKLKIALLVGQLVFGALDARVSRRNVQSGGVEYNPLVRPLVHSNAIYAFNASYSLANYWLARKLERKHAKLSLVPQSVDLSGHVSGWLLTRQSPALKVRP